MQLTIEDHLKTLPTEENFKLLQDEIKDLKKDLESIILRYKLSEFELYHSYECTRNITLKCICQLHNFTKSIHELDRKYLF